MHVLVAGAAGVLGQHLVPELVARGHRVTATTTRRERIPALSATGAKAVLMDGLDRSSVRDVILTARPDTVVHQMTAISPAHSTHPGDMKNFDRWFATTIQLRTRGTDTLLEAAAEAGVTHVVAQSYGGWNGMRRGGWVKTEHDPLDLYEGTRAQPVMEAIAHLESVVTAAGGVALRYGWLYGPGATDSQIEAIRRRQYPIVGTGAGHTSWVHLHDAATATANAIEQRATGVYNIGDDEPAAVSEWLPYLAQVIGAKPPRRVPIRIARMLAGDVAVRVSTEGRGFSNAKAKEELGWTLRYVTWREGFKEAL